MRDINRHIAGSSSSEFELTSYSSSESKFSEENFPDSALVNSSSDSDSSSGSTSSGDAFSLTSSSAGDPLTILASLPVFFLGVLKEVWYCKNVPT